MSTNAWSHLALTYDGTNMRLYVNGALVATRAQTGPIATSNAPLRIGGNAVWGEWFAGQIDEARVYNRALSAAEVVTDSNSAGTPDTVPPTTPTSLTATGGVSSVALTWSLSTDNVATPTYEVHRSLVGGFSPVASTRIASGLTAPSYTDTPTSAGTYYYRVIASDGTNLSSASAQASAAVTGDVTPPSVPTGVKVTTAGTTAVLTWTASADNVAVKSYQVQRPSSAGTTSFQVSAPTVTLTDAGLSAGTYSYAVKATDAADSSGTGNAGTLENGPVWTTAGKYGGAINFDSVNDWVSVPDANSLDLTTALTVSAWIRPTSLGAWREVLLKERPAGLTYALYGTGASGNRPNGQLSIGGTDRAVNATAAVAANAWTHVAMTYDCTTMRFYTNGIQVATKAQTGAVATSAGALRIGGNSVWGEWFTGQIDEVRVQPGADRRRGGDGSRRPAVAKGSERILAVPPRPAP